MELFSLPYEVLLNILTNLSLKQLSIISIASKYASEIYKDDYLWNILARNACGVKDKIYDDKSWYDNYMYIQNLFTQQQLDILHIIKKFSPKYIDLLRSLNNYTEYPENYTNPDTGHVYWSTYPLNKVIVWVSQSKIYPDFRRRYILVPHSRHNGVYLDLEIGQHKLITHMSCSYSRKIPPILNKRGSEITTDNDNTYYVITLTRPQLQALMYMYI